MLTYLLMSLSLLINNKYSWSTSVMTLMMTSLFILSKEPMLMNMNILSMYSMSDKMSMLMISLTIWVSALMITASSTIKSNNLFKSMILILMMILILCFSSTNLFMFYVWFEASLIPTMLIITMWGHQPERISASFYLMLYTISASLPLLIILLKISTTNLHSNMSMYYFMFPSNMMVNLAWTMLMLAFLVKMPIFSMHLWLPKAHVEAPIAGSMILAAILLKLGSYGMMRWNLIFPMNNFHIMLNLLLSISLIGAAITNMMCIQQSDMKSLIAYSSIGHMGLVIMGILSMSKIGQYGSLIMMIAHGLTSSALFCLTNLLYEMKNTRSTLLMAGSLSIAPSISIMWFMAICFNMAVPPSINLLSEILLMMASFSYMWILTLLLLISTMTTTIYSLYLYISTNHNNTNNLTPMIKLPTYSSMTMLISHFWPILIIMLTPMYVSMWC